MKYTSAPVYPLAPKTATRTVSFELGAFAFVNCKLEGDEYASTQNFLAFDLFTSCCHQNKNVSFKGFNFCHYFKQNNSNKPS